MREKFAWRLRPSEEEFKRLWKEAIFILDTNVLLDLYRLSKSTTNELLDLFESLNDRLWLPYQVCDEFFKNRENVIESESSSFSKALKQVDDWVSEQCSLKSLKGPLDQTGRIVRAEIGAHLEKMDTHVESIKKLGDEIKKKIEETRSHQAPPDMYNDEILERVLNIFHNKVGTQLEQRKLDEIYQEGEERFKKDIPPGFGDKNKQDHHKYNDLVIWKEVLIYASLEPKDVIMLNGERKPDWWEVKNGQIKFPHLLLRKEFSDVTQKQFWMYSPEQFLEEAKKYLGVKIKDSAIIEAAAIAEDEQRKEALRQRPLAVMASMKHSSDRLFPDDDIDSLSWNQLSQRKYLLDKVSKELGYNWNNILKEQSSIEDPMLVSGIIDIVIDPATSLSAREKIFEAARDLSYLNRNKKKTEERLGNFTARISRLMDILYEVKTIMKDSEPKEKIAALFEDRLELEREIEQCREVVESLRKDREKLEITIESVKNRLKSFVGSADQSVVDAKLNNLKM